MSFSKFFLVTFLVFANLSMAADLVQVKTAGGDIVLVEPAELKAAYVKHQMTARIETNSDGAELNDDGTVTVHSPKFKYDGQYLPILSAADLFTVEGTCRFLGYATGVMEVGFQLPLTTDPVKGVRLYKDGTMLQVLLTHNTITSITCKN